MKGCHCCHSVTLGCAENRKISLLSPSRGCLSLSLKIAAENALCMTA